MHNIYVTMPSIHDRQYLSGSHDTQYLRRNPWCRLFKVWYPRCTIFVIGIHETQYLCLISMKLNIFFISYVHDTQYFCPDHLWDFKYSNSHPVKFIPIQFLKKRQHWSAGHGHVPKSVSTTRICPNSWPRGRVGRVTDCGVRGPGFKFPGSILTSRTETSSLSRVIRDGGDPCSVPLSGWKKSPTVECLTWPLNSHHCSENDTKTKTKKTDCAP